jgi:hypothetical protein
MGRFYLGDVIVHTLPLRPDCGNEGLECDMLRVVLIGIERRRRFKHRIQNDVIGTFIAGLGQRNLEGQRTRHKIRARV